MSHPSRKLNFYTFYPNIFGQSLSVLTCSRLIKDLNSQYEIDIYAPKSILEDIEIPQTDLINIIKSPYFKKYNKLKPKNIYDIKKMIILAKNYLNKNIIYYEK